jgi:hypothetical protein
MDVEDGLVLPLAEVRHHPWGNPKTAC